MSQALPVGSFRPSSWAVVDARPNCASKADGGTDTTSLEKLPEKRSQTSSEAIRVERSRTVCQPILIFLCHIHNRSQAKLSTSFVPRPPRLASPRLATDHSTAIDRGSDRSAKVVPVLRRLAIVRGSKLHRMPYLTPSAGDESGFSRSERLSEVSRT